MIYARRSTRGISTALLTALALVWLVPAAMMLAIAFSPPEYRSTGFGGLKMAGFSLRNFQIVFADAPILRHLLNSLLIAGSSVVLVVAFGSMAAYAFARMKSSPRTSGSIFSSSR